MFLVSLRTHDLWFCSVLCCGLVVVLYALHSSADAAGRQAAVAEQPIAPGHPGAALGAAAGRRNLRSRRQIRSGTFFPFLALPVILAMVHQLQIPDVFVLIARFFWWCCGVGWQTRR